MSDENTVGRESVQIVEMKQPICGNVYGVSPCTASGVAGLECYNTRATCQDPDNYRHTPEFLLTPDLRLNTGDIITSGEVDRTENLFAGFDVYIPDSPDGCIWEQGNSVTGSYLGFTIGLLTWRTGDGSTFGGTNTTSKIAIDVSDFHNKEVTIFCEWVKSTSDVNLWIWDDIERVMTFIATQAPVTPYATWAGTDSGEIGGTNGVDFPVGESSADYNGDIHEGRIYNSLAAPNMVNPFVIPLFFSGGFVAEQKTAGIDYVIPSLNSVSTQPTKVNLSASNINATGLGNRAVMNASFQDHPHTDQIVDPYLATRLSNPMDRASFWSKWFVRNKYRFNMLTKVHEGYLGQSLSEMRSRSYILTGSGGPSESGKVGLQFKDILARAEERKSQAPIASNGVLVADITDVQTTFSIQGASSTEYPVSGTVRIGDELITYSSFVANGSNFDFTVSARGTDGSTAEAHSLDDTVQSCLRFTSQNVKQIVTTLLVDWSGISRGYIDQITFTNETENFLAAYILSAVISEPISVSTLLSELQEQVGFYIWWHERDRLIKMAAVRGVTSQPELFTDEDNIIAGTFSISDMPRNRISQVWFSYGQIDKTESLTKNSNYLQTLIQADLPSENIDKYGEKSVRKINSRWIDSQALALSTASKTVVRYSDVPRQGKFRADAKDRGNWVGDTIRISHFLDVDFTGLNKISTWTIVSAEEVVPGETIEYTVEDTTLYGKITLIQANGSVDYPGAETAPFSAAYIGDNNGLLSDGTNSARIT